MAHEQPPDDSSAVVPLPAGGALMLPRIGSDWGLNDQPACITDLDGGEPRISSLGGIQASCQRRPDSPQTSRRRVGGCAALDLLDETRRVLCRAQAGQQGPGPS